MNYPQLERLIEIVSTLRSENGCKWDREQTHATLKRNMLEEAYEAVDAIDDGDILNLREELGDVLLQVVLHAQIAKDNGNFDIEDVAKELGDKLIHRHPHVFGDKKGQIVYDAMEQGEESHGLCYGMAATTGSLLSGFPNVSSFFYPMGLCGNICDIEQETKSLELGKITAKTFINHFLKLLYHNNSFFFHKKPEHFAPAFYIY